jgi:ubiquinone/menaquinone biosynthesis C-methylase UbiE
MSETSQGKGWLHDFGPMAARYEEWYETPEGRKQDRIQKADVLTLLPRPHPGDRLLDVGCGTGHWSRFFASLGYDVLGVDVSEEMVETARAHGLRGCFFAAADACDLPFEDDSFHIVTAIAALEFTADASCAVREMFRCVMRGGTIIVGALNRLAPINRNRLAEGKQPYASGRLLTPGELRDLLAPYGTPFFIASSVAPDGTAACGEGNTPLEFTRRRLAGPLIVAKVRK